MSGVTIMILIILLITILMSYVLYCDPDTNPDLASLGENMVTNLISPSVILTEGEKIKSPRSLQVENPINRFLLNIQEEESAVFVSRWIFAARAGLCRPDPPDCGQHREPRALPQRHQRHHLHQHPERLQHVIRGIGDLMNIIRGGVRHLSESETRERMVRSCVCVFNSSYCVRTSIMAASFDVFKIVGQEITTGGE